MHEIAHGANSVQYSQSRKSRGAVEQFYVEHINTLVGQEIAKPGKC